MKKKITYVLIFLIIVAIFACGKVNASYIGQKVLKDTAGGNGYYLEGNNPGPNQLGDVKGFYCLNHNQDFNSYTIDREMDLHFNSDGTINSPIIYGGITERMNLSDNEYAFAYLFGTEFGNPDKREIRQYAIWRIKGTDDYSILDKWKEFVNPNSDESKSAAEYVKAKAYQSYMTDKKTAVEFYTGNDIKWDGDYFGPFYIKYGKGTYEEKIGARTYRGEYKPTFSSITVNDKTTIASVYTKNGETYSETLLNNVESGKAFYIKGSSLKSSNYSFKLKYKDIFEGDLYICDYSGNGQHQAVIAGKFSCPEKELTTTAVQDSSIKLNLHKVNSNGKEIKSESKFTISATQYFINKNNTNVGEPIKIYENREISLENGNKEVEIKPEVSPTNNSEYEQTKVYVTITETEAPQGYVLLSKPLNIIYVKNKYSYTWSSTYCPYFETVSGMLGLTGLTDKGYKNLEKLLDENLLYYMYTYGKTANMSIVDFFTSWINNKAVNQYLSNTTLVEALNEESKEGLAATLEGLVPFVTNGMVWGNKIAPINEDTLNAIESYINEKTFTSTFGFETFGYWRYNSENRNAPWPHYYLSIDNDKIKVNNVENKTEGVGREDDIYIYNNLDRPVINSLTLFKTDESNGNNLLDGAKFTATFKNVESYKYNNVEIPLQDGQTQIFEVKDGKIEITDVVFKNRDQKIEITLEETEVPNVEGIKYKQLEGIIKVEIEYGLEGLTGNLTYTGTENVQLLVNKSVAISDNKVSYNNQVPVSTDSPFTVDIIIPNARVIDISGMVWLDVDSEINNKLNGKPNGKKDSNENGLENIIVYLYKVDSNEPFRGPILTNSNGEYSFKDIPYDENGYYVVFEYDGVHYKNTITEPGESKAKEIKENRESFNNKFNTIEFGKAINVNGSEIKLHYDKLVENDRPVSKLNTLKDENGENSRKINGKEVVQNVFAMAAKTSEVIDAIKETTSDVNFGLIAKGADLELGNNLVSTETTINGESLEEENPNAKKEIDNLYIGAKRQEESASYGMSIFNSDYTYRIRRYVNFRDEFTRKDYTENTNNNEFMSGEELKVYVTYEVDVVNRATVKTFVNEITYHYDEKFVFNQEKSDNIRIKENKDNHLIIDLEKAPLLHAEGKKIKLVFELSRENIEENYEYKNIAEITSYSTDDGLVDVDSEPGDLYYNNETRIEDDTDLQPLKVTINKDTSRVISGYAWEDVNKNGTYNENEPKVDGVIVQLIELKKRSEVLPNQNSNNDVYLEYIWQETVSGTNTGLKMSLDGQRIENYTYKKETGYYEFSDFIPGNYIVRFIYGDGTVVNTDIYGNEVALLDGTVLKYNGQDYQSTLYNVGQNPSVARDNEARRLETMAYAVDVDAEKGLLLKLFDIKEATDLNATEIKTLVAYYNKNYDPDIEISEREIINLDDVGEDALNEKLEDAISALQKEVLANTWMCAETSRIHVPVKEQQENTAKDFVLNTINFGLKERPKQTIELKKYMTGFKLTASNGQPLVDATIDINKYFDGSSISDLIDGIRNGLSIIPEEKIQYEAGTPTELNTIIEGSTLEFKYSAVVRNISDENYLSSALIGAYGKEEYVNTLVKNSAEVKTKIRSVSNEYTPGEVLGSYYYTGKAEGVKTPLTVVEIKDYVNNDLQLIATTGNVEITNVPEKHYILNTELGLAEVTVNTVLKTTKATNKLILGEKPEEVYSVELKPTQIISASGLKEFDNYIAEVMKYSNAAGRRATVTPGNAEIIDHEYRDGKSHEADEAESIRVQLGVATGQDKQTPYVWATVVVLGIAIVAVGAFTVKKSILK